MINGLKVETGTKQVEVDEGIYGTIGAISEVAAPDVQGVVGDCRHCRGGRLPAASTGATMPNRTTATNNSFFISFISLKKLSHNNFTMLLSTPPAPHREVKAVYQH